MTLIAGQAHDIQKTRTPTGSACTRPSISHTQKFIQPQSRKKKHAAQNNDGLGRVKPSLELVPEIFPFLMTFFSRYFIQGWRARQRCTRLPAASLVARCYSMRCSIKPWQIFYSISSFNTCLPFFFHSFPRQNPESLHGRMRYLFLLSAKSRLHFFLVFLSFFLSPRGGSAALLDKKKDIF